MNKFYFGRKKILIPQTSQEINENNIGDILTAIMPTVLSNINDYNELYNIYCGDQAVLYKTRPTEENEIKNNKVLANYVYEFVNFKTSYLIADGFKYAQTSDERTDDVTLLNKYYIDENKVAKDTDRARDMYINGTAYAYYSPKKTEVDLRGESPFNIINLDTDKTFVAYSTQIGNPKALSGYVTQRAVTDKDEKGKEFEKTVYDYTLYTDEFIFTATTNDGNFGYSLISISKSENPLGINPIIEYPLNKARLGVGDIVYSLLNMANVVASNQIDNVVDVVNSLLVIYNAEFKTETLAQLRKELGALSLFDKNPQMPAKAEYISNPLDIAGTNQLYERIIKEAHNICGVPIPSGQVTSGGDTGVARELGNGYQNADLVIKLEETAFLASEREALKIELNICKRTAGCKINELCSSDIEINATRHNFDNILSKVQAAQMLDSIGFPKESNLIITGIGTNPHELAALWEENIEKRKESMPMFNTNKDDNSNTDDDENQPNSGENEPLDIDDTPKQKEK